ncbi:MAG: DUF3592 domain-containing protein [Myxococcales bacterium]|nr:DUF3592 domain-containing protein [Myxococcales bacterium]
MEIKFSSDACGLLGVLPFFAAGAYSLALGVKSVGELLRRRATWRHAIATVTLVYPIGSGKRERFARKLRFDSPTGPVDFTTVAQSSFLEAGQEVPVRYDPQRPQNAMIDGTYHWVMQPVFLFFFGAVMILTTLLLAIR